MENPINITALNDFVFCPVSIYFHNLYTDMDKTLYQNSDQINGSAAHKNIDEKSYRSGENVLQSVSVYCEEYNLIGKIDIYYIKTKKLVERKKKIKTVYDGYIFQLYAQYFAMREMGYDVKTLAFHSIDDNKSYAVDLPENNPKMLDKFKRVITEIKEFNIFEFKQTNTEKCNRCIYEPACDRSAKNDVAYRFFKRTNTDFDD